MREHTTFKLLSASTNSGLEPLINVLRNEAKRRGVVWDAMEKGLITKEEDGNKDSP